MFSGSPPKIAAEADRKESGTEEHVALSVVIPVFNERENLPLLCPRLTRVLDSLKGPYEIIFVDDGSRDDSFEVIRQFHGLNPRIKGIRLRRNFGQTAAFSAGFDHAQGDIVITMDADLQNHPEDVPLLLNKVDEGYDVVSGWRAHRKDHFLTRRLPSRLANWLISRVTGVKLHDYGCSLKAYRKDVVKGVRLYGEMHRFIPAIASWMGTRVAEVPVNHSPRTHGKSIYGLSRSLKVILDLITIRFLQSYSARPMQLFGLLGLLCFALGTAVGMYLSYLRLFLGQPIGDRPLLLLAALLVLVGVQLITMGLLGELVVRTYHETQGKPTYLIREQIK